jgi:hypothetical protein
MGSKSDAQTITGAASACGGTTEEYETQAGNINYVWDITGGTLNTDFSVEEGGSLTDNTITIKWINAGSYTININYDGGTNFDYDVTVHAVPVVNFKYYENNEEIQNSVCHNIVVKITATATGGDHTYYWFEADVNGQDLTVTTANTTNDLHIEEYPVMVTNLNSCITYDTARITVKPLPTIHSITGNTEVCQDATTQLSNETTGGNWESLHPSIATVSNSGLVSGINRGTATINYTVENTYDCSTTATFEILVKGATTLELLNETVAYDRTPKQISPIYVQFDGQNIGEHSWVTYEYYDSNNNLLSSLPENVGTYEVIAIFTGNSQYCGATNSTANFIIEAADMDVTTADNIPTQAYTGQAITPGVVVKHGTYTLLEGTEYTVAYQDNVNIGEATVTITGTGNYTGNITKKFNITDKSGLSEMLDSAQNIIDNDKDIYNDGSIKDLEEAVRNAVEVYDDPDATQAEIDAAVQALKDAMDNLIECIAFDSIVTTRWNNTLTVINDPAKNGNLTFKADSYQWYRKTADEAEYSKLNGQTKQYYSAGTSINDILTESDRYYVTMMTTSDEKMSTCGGHPTLTTILRSAEHTISTYPNPVNTDDIIYVDLNNENFEDLSNVVIEMYSTSGTLISTTNASETLVKINAPSAAGIYFIKVRTGNTEQVEKLVVK